ncbi:hypothetical protein F2Q69_00057643 [Brassica cretica]|uniref:Ribosomal L28e/Mak16 domain-containing protein n=1 Tax=Brassica cretica TaxID=69181 RepID=A0A8S9N0F1_BRACR|nr:hypothetical protein F2Q69_00057643 [Brassica cretica]
MTTVPGQLVWEIVKRNNCFLVKQFGSVEAMPRFSSARRPTTSATSTPTNTLVESELCSVFVLASHYLIKKCLANKKTVTIQVADKEQGVVLGTTKSKKQNKPKLSVNKSVLKKELVPQDGQSCCQPVLVLMSCDRKLTRKKRQLLCGVVDNYYRPDLKKAALARLSVISKGLRVAKSGPKRRNRQA